MVSVWLANIAVYPGFRIIDDGLKRICCAQIDLFREILMLQQYFFSLISGGNQRDIVINIVIVAEQNNSDCISHLSYS